MGKKYFRRRWLAALLAFCLMVGLLPSSAAEAATAPKLTKQKITLSVGEKATLKVKYAKQPVKWSGSNKKAAVVSGKAYGIRKAVCREQ